MTLEERFNKLKATPSSINEHLDLLRNYASRCESVAEFGVDIGQSTTALLMGCPKSLTSWDVVWKDELGELFEAADECWNHSRYARARFDKTWWWLELQDSRTGSLPMVDLLFIDSSHCYEHLSIELNRHHKQVRRHLILHDTVAYGTYGEAGPPQLGITPAIEEFLARHPEWVKLEEFHHCNGLLILERIV